MLTRSRIIGRASAYAGEPPDEALPAGVPHYMRFDILSEIETEILRDETLSTQNRMMAKVPVYLAAGQREFTLSQMGLEDPVYVSLNDDSVPDFVPMPIEIGNVSSLDQDARDGKRIVAFFSDKPQRGILSWNPGGSETLTVWYDRSPNTDPSAQQATFAITDSYVSLLTLLLAAQMLELMKQPIGELLKNRIARGLKQWEKFAKNGKQQGLVKKGIYRGGSGNSNIWDAYPGRVRFE